MSNATVLILMSTYNGEKYLAEQLDSLIAQTYTDWTLLIRDDGSNDKTLSVIQLYLNRDQRIRLHSDALGNLNTKKSFSMLMEAALSRQEPYIFFCDQDDVWLPNKIANTVTLLRLEEKDAKTTTPILVHTDLRVVDHTLKTIHSSFLKHERLNRNEIQPLKTLLINNYVTGCTVGINRALLQLATPVPEDTFMHDWWCALCAATTGKIAFIHESLILYRQHHQNSIGSKNLLIKSLELLHPKKTFSRKVSNLRLCFKQAAHLPNRTAYTPDHQALIQSFSMLPKQSLFTRYRNAIAMQIKPACKIRGMVFWLMLGFI